MTTLEGFDTYLGSTMAEDGELEAEVTHRVQSGWKNWKRVSGVLCDRQMNVVINEEKCVQDSGAIGTGAQRSYIGIE